MFFASAYLSLIFLLIGTPASDAKGPELKISVDKKSVESKSGRFIKLTLVGPNGPGANEHFVPTQLAALAEDFHGWGGGKYLLLSSALIPESQLPLAEGSRFPVQSDLSEAKGTAGVATFSKGQLLVEFDVQPLPVESGVPYTLKLSFLIETDPGLKQPVFIKSARQGKVFDRLEVEPTPGVALYREDTGEGVRVSLWNRSESQRQPPANLGRDLKLALSLGKRDSDGGNAVFPQHFSVALESLPLRKGVVNITGPLFSTRAEYDGTFLIVSAEKELYRFPAGVEKSVKLFIRTDPHLVTAVLERVESSIKTSTCGNLLSPPNNTVWSSTSSGATFSEGVYRAKDGRK